MGSRRTFVNNIAIDKFILTLLNAGIYLMKIKNIQKTSIELQLDKLFELAQQLNILLEKEQYEQFQQQQCILSAQIQSLIKNNSTENLSSVLKKLLQLEKNMGILKSRADICFKELKNKSLL